MSKELDIQHHLDKLLGSQSTEDINIVRAWLAFRELAKNRAVVLNFGVRSCTALSERGWKRKFLPITDGFAERRALDHPYDFITVISVGVDIIEQSQYGCVRLQDLVSILEKKRGIDSGSLSFSTTDESRGLQLLRKSIDEEQRKQTQ